MSYSRQLAAAVVAGASLVVLLHWITPLDLFSSWATVLAASVVAELVFGD